MKLPKTINICGKTFAVVRDRKLYGGKGSTASQKITIGTKYPKNERHFENFIHEVAEVIACEREYRYGDGHSENSVFVMNHKEFDVFIQDFAAVLKQVIKE